MADLQASVIMPALRDPGPGAEHRPYQLVSVLRDAGYDVHVVVSADSVSEAGVDGLRGQCKYLHTVTQKQWPKLRGSLSWCKGNAYLAGVFGDPSMQDTLREIIAHQQLVAVCGATVHPMLMKVTGGKKPATRYLVDLAEPISQQLTDVAQTTVWPMSWIARSEARAVHKFEVAAASMADLTLTEQSVALQRLARRAHNACIWQVGNGVPQVDSDARGINEAPNRVMFLGDVQAGHHQRTVKWLAQQVWPMLRRRLRGCQLVIVGRNIPKAVAQLAELPGIEINDMATQPVSMPRLIRDCVLGIAAQRQARDMADPVLRFMAYGRAVVATTNVATILPDQAGLAPLLADTGNQIVAATLSLLDDRALAAAAGERGRSAVMASATWEDQWQRVRDIVNNWAQGQSPPLTGDPKQIQDLATRRAAAAKDSRSHITAARVA